jgi:hypothetical protein
MNVVGRAVGQGTTIYSDLDVSAADSLIFALRKADRFDELIPAWWHELGKGRFGDL